MVPIARIVAGFRKKIEKKIVLIQANSKIVLEEDWNCTVKVNHINSNKDQIIFFKHM